MSRRVLPFHSKLSCSLKNSLNAGSTATCCRLFGTVASGWICVDGLLFCGDLDGGLGRHICANKPSIWRMPLRILRPSLDEMLSKASDKSASIVNIDRVRVVRNHTTSICSIVGKQVTQVHFQPACGCSRVAVELSIYRVDKRTQPTFSAIYTVREGLPLVPWSFQSGCQGDPRTVCKPKLGPSFRPSIIQAKRGRPTTLALHLLPSRRPTTSFFNYLIVISVMKRLSIAPYVLL